MRKNIKTTYFILSLLLIVGLLSLWPQADTLSRSMESIGSADLKLLIIGLCAVYLTYVVAALTLRAIALKPLDYQRTLLVQLASGFATKLVPAGIGGLALNARYLVKNQHTFVQASSVMALGTALGFVGHLAILISVVLFSSIGLPSVWQQLPTSAGYIVVAVLFGISMVIVSWARARLMIVRVLFNILKTSKVYILKPRKLLYGLAGASVVTLLFAFCLYICAQALGTALSPLAVLWVLTAGLVGASVTPTPGGLGGAEAALTGALITTGLTLTEALPIALAFRLLAYWIPIMPGFLFFRFVLSRRYI